MKWFILIVFSVVLPTWAFAQAYEPIIKNESYSAGPYYEAMTAQLLASVPDDFDYGTYRVHYSSSRRYEPLGEQIKDKILNLAYTIQTSDDLEETDEARKQYEVLVHDHLAHIGIVTLALSLSFDDQRLGRVAPLKKIQNGLFKSVLDSGTGTTLINAYDVITLDEETMLLGYLKIRPSNTITAHEGSVYYNMHDYQDAKTNQNRTIFVDTTIPMKHLERKRREESKPLDLRR